MGMSVDIPSKNVQLEQLEVVLRNQQLEIKTNSNDHSEDSADISEHLSEKHSKTAFFETARPISCQQVYAATLGNTGKKEIQLRYIDDFDTDEDGD